LLLHHGRVRTGGADLNHGTLEQALKADHVGALIVLLGSGKAPVSRVGHRALKLLNRQRNPGRNGHYRLLQLGRQNRGCGLLLALWRLHEVLLQS